MKALVSIALVIFGLSQWGRAVHDPDLGWQLLGGSWILEHGRLPPFDFINSLNSSWHDYHWLSQIALAYVYDIGGFPALRISFGILMAALALIFAATAYAQRSSRSSHLIVSFIAITCLFLIAPVSSIRPQMMAVLVIGIAQLKLIQKPKPTEPFVLFLLTVLLANFHVYWVFIPLLWFLYRLVPALINRGPKHPAHIFWHAPLLCFAGFCTPYTWQNYALLWDYANLAPILKESIREFRSAFAISLKIGLILSALIFIWARMVNLRRLRSKPGQYLAAALGFVLSMVSVKYLTLCALFSIPFLSAAMHAGIRLHASRLLKRERMFVLFSLAPLACLVAYFAILHFPKFGPEATEEVIAKRYAADTCKILPTLELAPSNGRDHVRLATDFNHGGWCRWAAAQANPHFDIRVTTDGRTQYVPAKRLEDSINLFSGRAGWEETLKEISPDAVLVSQTSALKQLLLLKPEWQIAYQDQNFSIFKPLLSAP